MADTASTSQPENETLNTLNASNDRVPFFKKRIPKKNLRNRKESQVRSSRDSDDDDDDAANEPVSEVVTKERRKVATPFIQGTRRRGIKRSSGAANDDDEEDQSSIGVQYEADRSAKTQKSDATRYATEWELEAEELKKQKAKENAKSKNVTNSKMQVGPQRAPANIRVTARFDYQPDVCKDYKETGFCGYGDSCIFLHDRGDYKTGWQLEKEWEEAQRNKTKFGASDPNKYAVSESESEEELPFACLICRQEFKNPVVTRCNHYYCEQCAIDYYKKSPKCYACGAATSGVFNTAKNMLKKLAEKKKRMQESKSDDEVEENNDFEIEGLKEKSDTSSSSEDESE